MNKPTLAGAEAPQEDVMMFVFYVILIYKAGIITAITLLFVR